VRGGGKREERPPLGAFFHLRIVICCMYTRGEEKRKKGTEGKSEGDRADRKRHDMLSCYITFSFFLQIA